MFNGSQIRSLAFFSVAAIVWAHSAQAGEQSKFTHQPARQGQLIIQDLRASTDLSVTYKQANQVISSADNRMVTRQRRRITILTATPGQAAKVQIKYESASMSMARGESQAQQVDQPVQGKTYIVSRQLGGPLVVTDAQGQIPPAAELAIVSTNMAAVGQSNPLALFLNGRVITPGQKLHLPKHLAKDLLNSGQEIQDVSEVSLVMNGTREINGNECGVFDARITTVSPADGKTPMVMPGRLAIELDTCRTLSSDFSAPLAFVEERGPEGGRFEVINRGELQVTMRAQYAKL